MSAELFSPPSRALDANASPYSGAKWTFTATGTTTPQAVYTSAALTTPLSNPVVADAGGKFPAIYFNSSLTYRGVCKSADGSVTLHDIDPINNDFSGIFADPSGSGEIGFIADLPGAVTTTVQGKLRQFTTPQDVGIALEATSQGIGTGVLQLVTTGVKNTGFGYHALQNNTDGQENTAFGYRALSGAVGGVDPDGDYNTAFGSFALASMTTGFKNAAFGRAAADNLTTGSQVTALGYGSMHWATVAQNCVAVGMEALHGGTSGPVIAVGSVGVGFHALYECLSGDYNAALGTSALAFLTTGDRNTAVGTNALNAQTTASDCVGVGYGAGVTNTGSGNIFIGAGADANAGRANVTVIGTSMTATTDNTLLLGNGQTVIPGTTAADIGSAAKPWNYGIFANALSAMSGTAIPAGGAAGKGFLVSSTPNFGVFFGSGVPTLSAAKGSLYLRSDGSSTSTRMYINTDNGTTWTAVTTAA